MFGKLIKTTPGDKMFSLYIRYRDHWTCQRCFRKFPERSGKLDNSHYWGRGNLSVRHDEENCAALCKGCHNFFSKNPGDHRDFFLKRLGAQRYDLLELRYRTALRYPPDDKIIVMAFQALLRDMGVYIGRGPALAMKVYRS